MGPAGLWCCCVPDKFLGLVILVRHPVGLDGYDVDVPATSSQLHEWDIHIVCSGTDGAGVTGAALDGDADGDPADAAGVFGRPQHQGVGPGGDPERFGDLIEQ